MQVDYESRSRASGDRRKAGSIWPPLVAAIFCTALIAQAIQTILTGRANGDMMVMVCPVLGAIFLAIPAVQAWMACVKMVLRRK
jgi:hypothetical protein